MNDDDRIIYHYDGKGKIIGATVKRRKKRLRVNDGHDIIEVIF